MGGCNARAGFVNGSINRVTDNGALPRPCPLPHPHTVLLQNRDGALADVDLYYDNPGGRNLNIIKVRKVIVD